MKYIGLLLSLVTLGIFVAFISGAEIHPYIMAANYLVVAMLVGFSGTQYFDRHFRGATKK